jgi:UDP-N-acetylmuramate--alanine ligase
MRKIHLIGIGGSGLSAIATVLMESGYEVSGSDRQLSPQVQELQAGGARVVIGHRAENLNGVDLVLRSSAIPDDNVEVQAALNKGIPVLKRAEFLEQLVAGKQVLAIAGTHGKTTTTAMLSWVLTSTGRDPSYVIGGLAKDLERSAHAGSGNYFVIEADEYDYMFLGLNPALAVVTNVEHDHPDCFPTPDDFQRAFREFVTRLAPGGTLIACADDPGAKRLLAWADELEVQTYSYGIENQNYDFWAKDLRSLPDAGYAFDIHRRDYGKIAELSLVVPGIHNVLNSLAVMAIADLLGFDLQDSTAALEKFSGVGRRFDERFSTAGVTIIDDYAHHPTEIRATLAAARARYPGRTIWAVWQPHTYSRTRMLLDEFAAAFESADRVLVTDIYAAREALPEDGFSSRQIVEGITAAEEGRGAQVYYVPTLRGARDLLISEVSSGDVVLVLTAGNAIQISDGLVQALGKGQSAS